MIIKDFIKRCRSIYQSKKEQEFLRIVVYYAKAFYPQSFLGKPLLILPYFSTKTIKSVADKLGYSFNRSYPKKHSRSSVIVSV